MDTRNRRRSDTPASAQKLSAQKLPAQQREVPNIEANIREPGSQVGNVGGSNASGDGRLGLPFYAPNNGEINEGRCACPNRPSVNRGSRLAVCPKRQFNKRWISKSIFPSIVIAVIIGLVITCYYACQETKELHEKVVQIQRQMDQDSHVTKVLHEQLLQMKKLETLLPKDKTGGIPDFALESAGGRIVSTRDTELHPVTEPRWGYLRLYGCHGVSPAEMMLRPSCMPGECWAFRGSEGSAVIKLITSVFISSVTLQHITKTISHTLNINSAPNKFSIVGLDNVDDLNGHVYGNFTYDMNGKARQNFPVTNVTKRSYQYVEIFVHSNHGNQYHTCVYRLSVHGLMDPDPSKCKPNA